MNGKTIVVGSSFHRKLDDRSVVDKSKWWCLVSNSLGILGPQLNNLPVLKFPINSSGVASVNSIWPVPQVVSF